MRAGGAIRVEGGAGMSECVVRMEKPHVCITDNGYYGYCPMDRVWCIQRNAPPDITMREAYEAMTDKIPSWCPIICSLPEGHGRLGDLNELEKKVNQARIRVMQEGQDTNPYWECGDIVYGQKTIVPADTAERSET